MFQIQAHALSSASVMLYDVKNLIKCTTLLSTYVKPIRFNGTYSEVNDRGWQSEIPIILLLINYFKIYYSHCYIIISVHIRVL